MAQTFTSTDVTTGTNVFSDNQSQRVNENTLRSNFSGSSQPSDPVVGQHWYDTENNREMTYNGTAWVAVDTNTATQVDVKNSAGNLSNLKSFLSVAHNDDGTLKVTPTSSIDEFKENSIVVTYVNPTTFTTPNDLTGIFTQYRKVKVYLSASAAISSVSSSSYNGTSNVTTVVLSTSAMDATLTNIRYSIVQYGTPDEYLEKSGGTITGDIGWTGERHICNSNSNIGFYANDTSAGIYDWKNDRRVIAYAQSMNSIVVGDTSATTSFPGTVSAPTFSGHLVGTADNATQATSATTVSTTAPTGQTKNLVNAVMADNDSFRIQVGDTGSDNGYVSFDIADNGNEPIYFRQYIVNGTNGLFGTIAHQVTLLDGNGNTSFSGTVSAPTFSGHLVGTADNLNGYTAAQLIGESSHATNGYHKLPGGTIIQWGLTSPIGVDSSLAITFPIAFPNAVLNISTVQIQTGTSSETSSSCVVKYGYSTTGFTLMQDTSCTNSVNEMWFAIGY